MVELLGLILDEVDPLALPVCRAVCARWRDVVVNRWTTFNSSSSSSSTGPPEAQLPLDYKYAQTLARRGWLSILRWAWANGCPADLNQASFWAACGDQRQVLEWLHVHHHHHHEGRSNIVMAAWLGPRMPATAPPMAATAR
jgi:hypothetical protein